MKKTAYPSCPVRHQLNDVITQFEAAKAGMGITMLPCFLGDSDPVLKRLPPGIATPCWDIWILTHQDLRFTARVRAFIDFMVNAFDSHRDLLDGRCPQVSGPGN